MLLPIPMDHSFLYNRMPRTREVTTNSHGPHIPVQPNATDQVCYYQFPWTTHSCTTECHGPGKLLPIPMDHTFLYNRMPRTRYVTTNSHGPHIPVQPNAT